ncbi:hypothetical protein BDV96DRAFT_651935 [Lophiotrema nucula]|uniref:F-box domain-containing protein n=1 Tax=Lophiotrema nucula TaxID=690887 RepID=A0A6A5YR99_9PLEO|nr:hypothetical protein BDV96DRAFT_651935 [Lophiotrema nucula]
MSPHSVTYHTQMSLEQRSFIQAAMGNPLKMRVPLRQLAANDPLRRCYFLELPTEVRFSVYRYLLPREIGTRAVRYLNTECYSPTSLFLVSRTVYEEASAVLYERTPFDAFVTHDHIAICLESHWLETKEFVPAAVHRIRNLDACVSLDDVDLSTGSKEQTEFLLWRTRNSVRRLVELLGQVHNLSVRSELRYAFQVRSGSRAEITAAVIFLLGPFQDLHGVRNPVLSEAQIVTGEFQDEWYTLGGPHYPTQPWLEADDFRPEDTYSHYAAYSYLVQPDSSSDEEQTEDDETMDGESFDDERYSRRLKLDDEASSEQLYQDFQRQFRTELSRTSQYEGRLSVVSQSIMIEQKNESIGRLQRVWGNLEQVQGDNQDGVICQIPGLEIFSKLIYYCMLFRDNDESDLLGVIAKGVQRHWLDFQNRRLRGLSNAVLDLSEESKESQLISQFPLSGPRSVQNEKLTAGQPNLSEHENDEQDGVKTMLRCGLI